MKEGLIEKIKSRGYWRINFHPVDYIPDRLFTLSKCREIVEKNIVDLRGWFYPHFSYGFGNEGVDHGENFFQGWVDNGIHKEFWRMYLSGQFLHYLALCEDWLEEDDWLKTYYEEYYGRKIPQPGTILNVMGSIIYQIAEVFEFISRVCKEKIYDKGVVVDITLFNTKNRKLKMDDLQRIPISGNYITVAEKIPYKRNFYKEEILTSLVDLAADTIIFILDKFGFYRPKDIIKKDIEDFLSGRI